jgi:hypothetical protein
MVNSPILEEKHSAGIILNNLNLENKNYILNHPEYSRYLKRLKFRF